VSKHQTGLRSEILLTLAILFGASLLLGGFLFLRHTEQNLLQQRIQVVTLALRLAATSFDEKNLSQGTQSSDVFFKLQNELNAQSLWSFDRNLALQFSFHTEAGLDIPRSRLHELLLERNDLVELTWPGLLSFFNPDKRCSLFVAVPLDIAGRTQGVLAARFSLQDILLKLNTAQLWLIGYVLAFGVVLVTAGFVLIERNVIRPTRKLSQAARAIASGNLDLRLEKSGPSEIYALAESFNHMVEELKKSQLEAQTHIQSLSKANAEIQQTQHELIRSEKLATVGYIAAGMAHEIGNPLGALTGYLSLLQKDLGQGSQAELLREATNAAERIDRLVEQLLDYAAPTSACVEAIDPWSVVKEMVHLLELQGAFKNCLLIVDQELVLPPVRIDAYKLGQVLVNLLLNSKDACDVDGQITISGAVEQNQVKIYVADTGCGIPPHQRNTIFEPFYTTKAPGKGRGLGLAVCQRIMAEAQGEIRCESTLGEGSLFCLTLPLADRAKFA